MRFHVPPLNKLLWLHTQEERTCIAYHFVEDTRVSTNDINANLPKMASSTQFRSTISTMGKIKDSKKCDLSFFNNYSNRIINNQFIS